MWQNIIFLLDASKKTILHWHRLSFKSYTKFEFQFKVAKFLMKLHFVIALTSLSQLPIYFFFVCMYYNFNLTLLKLFFASGKIPNYILRWMQPKPIVKTLINCRGWRSMKSIIKMIVNQSAKESWPWIKTTIHISFITF